MEELAGWTNQGDAIEKTFERADFADAMRLVNAVAAVAEEVNHHPDITIRWNKVTFTLTTHSAGGLTDRDFSLAKRIEELA